MAAKVTKPDVTNLLHDFKGARNNPDNVLALHLSSISVISQWPTLIGSEYASFIHEVIRIPHGHFTDDHYKGLTTVSQELLRYTSLAHGHQIAFGNRFWRTNIMAMQLEPLHEDMKELWQVIASQDPVFQNQLIKHTSDSLTLMKYRPQIFA